jgi:membrane protein
MQSLTQLPWKRMAKDFQSQVNDDNVFNGAAALGYYLTLAVFPTMIFLLSILPYLPIRDLDRAIMDLLHQALPGQTAELLTDTVRDIASERQGGLLSFGLLATLWAASTGMYAVMQQLNITYNVKEARPFIKARAMALLLTLLFGVLVIGAFALIVTGGMLQNWLVEAFDWGPVLLTFFATLRWVIIIAALLLGFALIYYLAPNVKEQHFRWISPGSVIGVLVLLIASQGFRIYIENFGNYEATYGALGAMIVLMLWFYIAGLVLLLGSEINVVTENHLRGGKPPEEKQGKRTDEER